MRDVYTAKEQALLKDWVAAVHSKKLGYKTTVVCLEMHNGYEVVGTSSCINPADYDYEEGIFFATKDALLRVKDIVGYLQQEAFTE